MGEIAEAMLDGFLCEGCGEWMGEDDVPGHPVRCEACERVMRDARTRPRKRRRKVKR